MYTTTSMEYADATNAVLGIFATMWLVMVAVFVFTIICEWRVYKKLNKPGWAVLIPFYNDYVLFDAVWSTREFWKMIIFTVCGIVASFVGGFMGGLLGPEEGIGAIVILVFMIVSWVLDVLVFVWAVRLTSHLSKAFGHGAGFTVGLLFLPVIFYAILAFSKKEVAQVGNAPDYLNY